MNTISISLTLHLIFAVIWVGGMFFAYFFLRPVAAQQLEPPVRLRLWAGVFQRFFPLVWSSVIILPTTGYLMSVKLWQGFANAPVHIHIMTGIGVVMIMIFMHVFFAPYKRLRRAIQAEDWPAGGKSLNQIRMLIQINVSLGLVLIAITAFSRYAGLS